MKSFALTLLAVWIVWAGCPAGSVGAAAPIRIGASLSMEGKYKEPSNMVLRGYRLWESQVNRRGGLLGRPVKLVVKDDGSLPDRVEANYREMLYGANPVDLVLSPYGTPLTLAALSVTESKGYVLLASAAAGARIWDQGAEFVFGVYAPADRYFIGFLDLLARNGIDSVALVFEDSPFHRSIARGVRKWADPFGVRVVGDHPFAAHAPDLAAVMSKVQEANPKALIVSAYPPQVYEIIGWMKQHRFRPPGLGITIAPVHPDFRRRVGAFAEGIVAPSQWEPDERIPFPGTRQFIHDFRDANGIDPSYHAGSAYAACQILERAVKHEKSLDNQKIRDFIRSLNTVTVIGRFKVDHTGRQTGHNPLLIQWQDGKKEIVYPSQMKTAPFRLAPGTGDG